MVECHWCTAAWLHFRFACLSPGLYFWIWHTNSRQDNVEAMLLYSKGLELDPSAILDHAEEAINAAIDAGVFTCPDTSLQKEVPDWKITFYQMVLHRFGLTTFLHTSL